MRHIVIRGMMGLIWLTAAIVSSLSGNWEMSVFYILLCGAFLFSAYGEWKREKDGKGGK